MKLPILDYKYTHRTSHVAQNNVQIFLHSIILFHSLDYNYRSYFIDTYNILIIYSLE